MKKEYKLCFVTCVITALIAISCFTVGLLLKETPGADSAMSLASTVASIALSIVAIMYTMIEGAESTRSNLSAQEKLRQIESYMRQTITQLDEIRQAEKRLLDAVPKFDHALGAIVDSGLETPEVKALGEDLRKQLDELNRVLDADLNI